MASTYYSGLDGEMMMKFQGQWQSVAKVRNWSFSQSMAVLDTTTLGDTDRTLIDGVRSLSGSCSLMYYSDDDDLSRSYGLDDFLRRIMKPYKPLVDSSDLDPGGTDLGTTFRSGKCGLKFQVDRNRSGFGVPSGEGEEERYLWMQAYVTNITMTMSVGEVLSADVTFESDGAAIENTFSNHTARDD